MEQKKVEPEKTDVPKEDDEIYGTPLDTIKDLKKELADLRAELEEQTAYADNFYFKIQELKADNERLKEQLNDRNSLDDFKLP